MRILVVEDEEKVASFIRKGLEQSAHTVDVAGNGEEALVLAEVNAYDAIILDLMLPGKDGLQVVRELRARGSAVPVLALTARGTLEDRVRGLDSGCDDYLAKPFAFDELQARLRALLRRGASSRAALLHVADLTFDPAARLVERAGRPIALTRRELGILETLLRRPGWVVSRDAIIESVWGFEFPDASNLVEVYVGRLRKKLGDEASRIETVWGIGYRLKK